MSFKAGKRRPLSARKLRKSHCGIKAMNLHGAGTCANSAILRLVFPISTANARISECGNFRKSSISPSSCMIIRVEGCTVSPRKSRRKSACFSKTTVLTPARPSKKPSIMPAGPPPAIQH